MMNINYQHYAELKEMMKKLPKQFVESLDARQFNGSISLPQMIQLIKEAQSEETARMADDIASVKKVMEDGKLLPADSNSSLDELGDAAYGSQFNHQYHPDGVFRKVSPGWTFPMNQLQQMYQYWHNQLQKICPMKHFHSVDVSFLGDSARIRLNEVKQLMEIIDKYQVGMGQSRRGR